MDIVFILLSKFMDHTCKIIPVLYIFDYADEDTITTVIESLVPYRPFVLGF